MTWIISAIILLVILIYFYKNEIEVKTVFSRNINKKGIKIGIVSSWARQGVPYQSRFLSKCLSKKHQIFIFAYKNYIKDEADWGYKKLVFTKMIKSWKVINWIKKENINVVFFPDRLEDIAVLDWCDKNKVATVMDINYETIKKNEFDHYKKYTVLHCPVKCTQDLLRKHGFKNTSFVRWGIDNNIFRPMPVKIDYPIRFFHNAGYGGAGWRKNTLAVVEAFDLASKKIRNIQLILKSQKPICEYPDIVRDIIKRNNNIMVNEKDLKMNDLIKLYHSCHVSVLPSKWEGIGLPFIESLAIGLPVITVDAPPMNEWVKNNYNGLCAKVERWEHRKDKELLVKGALVNIYDLSEKIIRLSEPKLVRKMRANAIWSVKNSKADFTKEMEKLVRSL